jgi:glutamyl-tRNA(Gln) amidotransferase subunit D
MHENMQDESCLILPPLKSKKMHSSRRDAFRPINTKPIARVDYRKKKIDFIDYTPTKAEGKLKVTKFNEKLKVGILRAHVNMFASEVLAYKGFDGLVLEGTGIGHYPVLSTDTGSNEHDKIADAIRKLAKKMPVVLTVDTIYGRVNMEMYTVGRKVLGLGVIGTGLGMITEVAFIKLAWLLSNYSKEEAKKLYCQNLRGEISERTEQKDFLI